MRSEYSSPDLASVHRVTRPSVEIEKKLRFFARSASYDQNRDASLEQVWEQGREGGRDEEVEVGVGVGFGRIGELEQVEGGGR